MIKKVKYNLENKQILINGDRILLGVSGGVDSMVLFQIMTKILESNKTFKLIVAHIDHMLRNNESNSDREFVVNACRKKGIPCFTEQININAIAESEKISTEMAARKARYDFFEKCCRENNLNCIMTAHNADDQAETVLLRLIRGTTLTGISGISPKSNYKEFRLIRPMLDCSREEIVQYAMDNQIIWRNDASNASDAYLRNKIRHHITPFITKELNPAFVKNINKMTNNFKIDDDFIEKHSQKVLAEAVQNDTLDFSKLINVDPALQNRVIRTWLSNHIPISQIDTQTISKVNQLYKSDKATCQLELPEDYILKKSYDIFSVQKDTEQQTCDLCLPIKESCVIDFDSKQIEIKITKESGIIFDNTDSIGQLPAKASLQIDNNAKIIIRTMRPGDRMEPLGLSGNKKLKDIFIDAKVPYEQRSKILLIEIDGIIAWIPGYRISEHFKVTNSNSLSTHIAIALSKIR
jgi:tRNA(Ile)-lysidine synthase